MVRCRRTDEAPVVIPRYTIYVHENVTHSHLCGFNLRILRFLACLTFHSISCARRGGQWNSGGQCHKETEPIFNESYLENYPSKMRVLENVLQEMRTPVTYLNISRLTDYRKDGHPSVYRTAYRTAQEQMAAEQSQDCSHWCLPGVPDTWNELLYASLLKMGWGSPT